MELSVHVLHVTSRMLRLIINNNSLFCRNTLRLPVVFVRNMLNENMYIKFFIEYRLVALIRAVCCLRIKGVEFTWIQEKCEKESEKEETLIILHMACSIAMTSSRQRKFKRGKNNTNPFHFSLIDFTFI